MKKFIFNSILVMLGMLIGSGVAWVYSYYPPLDNLENKVGIDDVLKFSGSLISRDNYSCEGKIKNTVGDVVASIIDLNSSYKRNMLSQDCYKDTCAISVTNCMPWQSQECGSRILKFNIDGNNEILENTFSCIDLP